MTKPIPEGYHSVTPYLVLDKAAEAIEFYKKAFGAEEIYRLPMGERIGHAEIKIGDSFVMLADEFPDMGHLGPKSRGGTTVSLLIYLPDVDTAFKKALDAGATQTKPLENQLWGDRMGTVTDPFGHQWSLATHVEDVSEDEIARRFEEFLAKQKEAEPA
ncbi:MAG TPA: VOC family protein [Sphingomicrobium sp.]|nr:VOC family protein [Sphingomicrobium sp.]